MITKLRDAHFRRKAAKALIFNIRELRIMHLLMIGKTDKQIAVALRIDEAALENHMTMLRQKLMARSRREAVIEAKKTRARPLCTKGQALCIFIHIRSVHRSEHGP